MTQGGDATPKKRWLVQKTPKEDVSTRMQDIETRKTAVEAFNTHAGPNKKGKGAKRHEATHRLGSMILVAGFLVRQHRDNDTILHNDTVILIDSVRRLDGYDIPATKQKRRETQRAQDTRSRGEARRGRISMAQEIRNAIAR